MLKLNLGCGSHKIDGFCNIDKIPSNGIMGGNICDMPLFETESADLIYCAHALQCLPNRDLVPVALKEWCRILKQGCSCIIEIPTIFPLIMLYVKGSVGIESVIQGVYGINEDGLRQNICFDFAYLMRLLREAGFQGKIEQIQQPPYSRHDSKTNLVVLAVR
jgi:predicted SAM-dependent methyltransferase